MESGVERWVWVCWCVDNNRNECKSLIPARKTELFEPRFKIFTWASFSSIWFCRPVVFLKLVLVLKYSPYLINISFIWSPYPCFEQYDKINTWFTHWNWPNKSGIYFYFLDLSTQSILLLLFNNVKIEPDWPKMRISLVCKMQKNGKRYGIVKTRRRE